MEAQVTTTETTTTELEPILREVVAGINKGSIDFNKLIAALAPKPPVGTVPEKIPLPAVITDEERVALKRLAEVFGKIVPEERRALESAEVTALGQERRVLDTIETMVEKRKGNIRTTVFNHFDVSAENSGLAGDLADRDKDGFYLLADEVVAAGTDVRFTREIRNGSPSLDHDLLKAIADDPDNDALSHEDYLAFTEQIRVVDPNKVMLHLRKNPHLVKAIAAATTTTSKTASFYARKAKK